MKKKSPKKDNNTRSPYRCFKCGQPKKGHICTSDYPLSPNHEMGEISPSQKKRKKENNTNNNNNNTNNKNKKSKKISDEQENSSTEEVEDYSDKNKIQNLPSMDTNVPIDPLDNHTFQITPSLFDEHTSIYGFDKNSSISSSYLATASLDGENDFDSSWFDLAINGISMLKTFFNINPPREISQWADENQINNNLCNIHQSLEEYKKKFVDFKKNIKKPIIKKDIKLSPNNNNKKGNK
eukprot:TRINITY_DN14433_c0_g1_i1.p1 TRINITY_DN14433_c0_g1~~TRINITY_DN14433_c0_g1_i1.p1  ORF type:complete len:238 (-),score=64.00 TRINITY_DN14433_c0_g1_i1:45-758(-)